MLPEWSIDTQIGYPGGDRERDTTGERIERRVMKNIDVASWRGQLG
jgi:hypothetical protein